MVTKKRINKKVWLILGTVLILQVLFDPLSGMLRWGENMQARIGLPIARQRWDSQKIEHYSFDVTVSTPHLCIWGANIEVRNGTVIDFGKIKDPAYRDILMPSPMISAQIPHDLYFLCN
jgi:hypothetical protein